MLLELAEDGAFTLIISTDIRSEIKAVLLRKFAWQVAWVDIALEPLLALALPVVPNCRIDACRDEADNRILECAVEGQADVIVTNDKDLLSLSPFQNVQIPRVREFLELLPPS